ncbi:hypothetical protein C8Q80DRAFT_1276078 [Daedaleopsis nitida]|nr:hypothetical protein C8Q80DRAFT_1276078 [Daedaleopsis nitida]
MSYTTYASAPVYSFSFSPSASPASPNAFALFASTQSPRETYHMYEDACQVLRPSNGRADSPRKAAKSGLKKIFGLVTRLIMTFVHTCSQVHRKPPP